MYMPVFTGSLPVKKVLLIQTISSIYKKNLLGVQSRTAPYKLYKHKITFQSNQTKHLINNS